MYTISICPTPSASVARHPHDRQPSKLMLNFGCWAGRLQSTLAHAPFLTEERGLPASIMVNSPTTYLGRLLAAVFQMAWLAEYIFHAAQ
jgi:hypothetical protein